MGDIEGVRVPALLRPAMEQRILRSVCACSVGCDAQCCCFPRRLCPSPLPLPAPIPSFFRQDWAGLLYHDRFAAMTADIGEALLSSEASVKAIMASIEDAVQVRSCACVYVRAWLGVRDAMCHVRCAWCVRVLE
jgi:hypothetical protein